MTRRPAAPRAPGRPDSSAPVGDLERDPLDRVLDLMAEDVRKLCPKNDAMTWAAAAIFQIAKRLQVLEGKR